MGTIYCVICLGTAPAKGPKARDFLQGGCVAIPIDTHKRVYGRIYMNGAMSHESHNLRYQSGRYMCVTCGYNATVRLHKLKIPCVPPESRTTYGDLMLKKFAAGDLDYPRSKVAKNASSLTPQEANKKNWEPHSPGRDPPYANVYQHSDSNTHMQIVEQPVVDSDETDDDSIPELPMIADQAGIGDSISGPV